MMEKKKGRDEENERNGWRWYKEREEKRDKDYVYFRVVENETLINVLNFILKTFMSEFITVLFREKGHIYVFPVIETAYIYFCRY